MQAQQQSDLLDIRQVVDAVKLSETTIRKKIKAGQFPDSARAVGNKRLWRAAQIKKYLSDEAEGKLPPKAVEVKPERLTLRISDLMEMFDCTRKLAENTTLTPGFPLPFRIKGSSTLRWDKAHVFDWWEKNRGRVVTTDLDEPGYIELGPEHEEEDKPIRIDTDLTPTEIREALVGVAGYEKVQWSLPKAGDRVRIKHHRNNGKTGRITDVSWGLENPIFVRHEDDCSLGYYHPGQLEPATSLPE